MIKITRLCLILLLLIMVSCKSTKEDEIKKEKLAGYLDRGDMYYKIADYKRAENQYLYALSIDPENIEALIRLGNIYYVTYESYLLQKDQSKALHYWNTSFNCFNEIIKHKPDYPEPYLMMARLNYCVNKLEESIKLLKKIFSMPSADVITKAIAHKELGRAYNKQENFTEALKEFKEYLRILPDADDSDSVRLAIRMIEKNMSNKE